MVAKKQSQMGESSSSTPLSVDEYWARRGMVVYVV